MPRKAAPKVHEPDNVPTGIDPTALIATNADEPPPYDPENSELKAEEAEHRTQASTIIGGGGPRKDGIPAALAEDRRTIPRPHYSLFKNNATQPGQRSQSFFNYWNCLAPWAKSRTMAYVYRHWPVLKPVPDESEEHGYIDKIDGDKPIQDDLDLLKWYGCGDYFIIFTEYRSKSAPKEEKLGSNQICQCFVMGLGGQNCMSNPPRDRRVNDVSQVDLDAKANTSYVAFLRTQRLLPEQRNEEAEMSSAAQAETFRVLAESNERLANKMVDIAKEGADKQTAPAANAENALVKGVVDGMSQTFGAAIGMLSDAGKRSNEILAVHQAPPPANPEVSELRAEIQRLRDDRVTQQLDAMRSEIATLRTNPQANAPPSNVKDTVSTFREMRSLFDELGMNPTKATDADAKPWWVDWSAELIRGLTPVLGPLVNVYVSRAMMAQRQVQQMPTGTVQQVPNPHGPNPPPQQQPQPQQIPAALTPEQQQQQQFTNLITSIAQPLDNYLAMEEEKSGAAFADWFCAGYPVSWFQEISKLGTVGLDGILRSYPQTAGVLAKYPAPKVQSFLGEFCGFQPQVGGAA